MTRTEALFVYVKRSDRNKGEPYWTFERMALDESDRASWVRDIEREMRETKRADMHALHYKIQGYQVVTLKWTGDE